MVLIHKRPRNDAEFLDVMSEIIFISGFRWDIVHSRWLKIRKAFHNFNIEKVSKANLINLLNKEGMISNRSKISAVITNAKLCKEIIKKKWKHQ